MKQQFSSIGADEASNITASCMCPVIGKARDFLNNLLQESSKPARDDPIRQSLIEPVHKVRDE